jgi:XrtN system VIT domain protein
LPDHDLVKILQTISDGRHQSNERLWSGDNLITSYIVSDIDIYPELRLAYTEKYLNVKNTSANGRWWGNTQEAIYTFYLPEGSVVTSLSLWINGKEEKAVLTSKQKAANAYSTIVGVEQRDPSVVHWQEGNTVTVRVFPCTTTEDRKFKLGITSPLPEQDGQVTYSNIVFRGPDANRATETTRVRVIGVLNNIKIPDDFKKDKAGDYISEHKYEPDFKLSCKTSPIAKNEFTFDGETYSLSEYVPEFDSVIVKDVYLDINATWTDVEVEKIIPLIGEHRVFVCVDETFINVGADNWDEVTDDLIKRNFSLFPFYKIKDVDHSLVVTKGKITSPHLSDIKDDEFARLTGSFFLCNKAIHVFNLGNEKSTYINSLRELRGLIYSSGSVDELRDMLKNNLFPSSHESDQRIILHDSKMIIKKEKIESDIMPNTAPDHLMRLFCYNDIMRKVGSHYYDETFVNEQLVDEAATSYIVSPVSSLIVLETQGDYKRFDINDKDNSLHNAAKASTGAVPEPHEWALIILFIIFVGYLKFRG